MKMAALRAGAILVFLSVFPGSERVSGQRAPCYECEDYKENHPRTSPYQQIRSHCSYPCECDDVEPTCPPDVSIIRDGCGCCPICAGQPGQPCDGTSVCDDRKGLICRYPYSGATVGICQAATGLPCMVFNKTYNHGETFQTDCRTQCSCQNGTYACSSLCPNENISPRGACTHPRLVEVPDQCCREWMCDSTEAEHPPVCKQQFTSWSRCSAECGLGISRRVSNLNQNCILQNETRVCQLRPCEAGMLSLEQRARHRHIRKGHECKATQRVRGPVRLRFGPCRSKKRYRPKFCGSCDDKLGDGCCTPQLSTTIKVEFVCSSIRTAEDPEDVLIDLIEPGRDLWWPDDLLAIGKQPGTTPPVEPASEPETRDGYASRVAPIVPKEDMHLLGKDKQNESPLGGDVLIYDPELSENVIGLVTPNVLKGRLETKPSTLSLSTEGSTTTATTTNPTTPKPKKKRKKKPRKAFTSWLEFRDEEYQMDEYEDEAEEDEHSRRKREAVGKKYSGSFREGYLEEVQAKENDYDDEDDEDDEDEEEDEDEDEDEEEEEEEEDEDSGEEEDEDEDEETTKRNRSARKPVFYAFYRRKREAAFSGKSAYPKKHVPKKEPEAPKVDRLARISLGRENPDVRKRRGKKAKIQAKERRTQAEKGRGNGIPERKAKADDGDLFRLGKILTGKDATREEPKRQRGKKPLYHTAGKVHKSRTRRHAPRPPWPEEEEDLSWGDHTVSFSVQWIVKCHCGRDCGADGTASPARPGAVVLRRVHRTAPP